MRNTHVKINLNKLHKFKAVVEQDLRGSGMGPVAKAIKQWAYIYRAFAMRRFDKASKGDGEWKPLSPATIAARKPGKKIRTAITTGQADRRFKKRDAGAVAILRDTGLLFAALTPTWSGKPGAIEERITFGIRVGFGGSGRYPNGLAIADIAAFHQTGGGRLPKRPIIVNPDSQAIKAMTDAMQRAIRRLGRNPDAQ